MLKIKVKLEVLFQRQLTCQHIAHYAISQKRHVVDNIPQAFEVCENVMHRVWRRLQRNFKPCEKLGCKNDTKVKSQLIIDREQEAYSFTEVYAVFTYVLCSFDRKTQCVYSHIHTSRSSFQYRRHDSDMAESNRGWLHNPKQSLTQIFIEQKSFIKIIICEMKKSLTSLANHEPQVQKDK